MSFYHPFINGSQLVTNGLISTFNANTLGNLFTTGGNVGIGKSAPTSALDVSGTVKADTINVTGITASNINFTGSLYQNGVAYSSSQWTTTSGNVSYTSGSIIGTSVSASNMISINSSIGTINATGITASNINFTGSLYQNGVAYSSSQWTTTSGNVSYTSGSVVTGTVSANNVITSDATIGTLTVSNFNPDHINTTSLTTANFIVGNLTTGTLVTNNVNVGVGSMFGGSFNAANNVAAPSNVTGFSFNSSNVASFTANVSVVISATSSLYEAFTLNGAYTSTGWVMTSTGRGDVSGVAFTITTGGQVQYTSTNVSGWSSSAFRFTINQNSINGNYSSLSPPTSGNTYIFDSISLTNTADALSLSSTGSMNIAGGLTVQKSLYAATISTSNFMITNLTAANFAVTNFTAGTMVANNVNVGINSMYGGSFNAANNVAAASNVTGFSFNSASVVSFSANVSVIVTGSTVSYEAFTLNGAYSSSGWVLNSSTRGDISGITITITSGGQIQYTSTNVAGWTSSVFRFSVNQNSLTGNYSSLSAPTSGNTYIYDSINLTNTTDAAAGSSVGSIYVSGGASVSKSLFVGTQISSANVISTNSTTGVLNATGITAGNINFSGNLYQNGAVFGGGATWNGFNVTASTSGNAWATTFSGTSFSSNGLDWVPCTKLRPTFKGVVYTNNTWYASSASNYKPLLTSTDLVNWSYNTSASALLTEGRPIVYGNNIWILGGNATASGNSIIYSTGGNVWTNSNSTLSGQCYAIAYNGSNMFVAGGYGTNTMAYSTNGSTWTALTSNVPTSYCYGIAYGNSTWVAVGQGTNRISYSSNGTSWTGIANPFGANGSGYGVVFGDGKFVAISGEGTYKIIYSANGTSWTGVTLPSEFTNYSFNGPNYITFNGTYFVIASGGPSTIHSSDGITWMYGNNPNIFTPSPSGIASTGQTSSSLMISDQTISFSTGTAQTSYYNTSGTFVAPKSAYYNISMSAYGIGGISGSSLVLGGSGVTNSALNNASQFIYLSSGSTLQPYISVGKFQSWQVMYT